MKRKSEFFKTLVFVVVLLAVMLGVSAAAVAWSEGNPPTSKTGTHDWIIGAAKVVADKNQAGSAAWLDLGIAQSYSHYPDEVYKDTNNHIYDVWGLLRIGNAPASVKSHYTAAVNALKARDLATASKEVGLMAHYYDDIWNPWHTTYELSNLGAQASVSQQVRERRPGPRAYDRDGGRLPVGDRRVDRDEDGCRHVAELLLGPCHRVHLRERLCGDGCGLDDQEHARESGQRPGRPHREHQGRSGVLRAADVSAAARHPHALYEFLTRQGVD